MNKFPWQELNEGLCHNMTYLNRLVELIVGHNMFLKSTTESVYVNKPRRDSVSSLLRKCELSESLPGHNANQSAVRK
uniref:Uncharacterized protein n=1 Tax=Arion vulgaris TaxID=1028688 RepID=A0A0B7BDQ6_9EUPU